MQNQRQPNPPQTFNAPNRNTKNVRWSLNSPNRIKQYREQNNITIIGRNSDLHDPFIEWRDYPDNPVIVNIVNHLRLQKPTPIQAQVIPIALSGQSLIGIAGQGAGKTLAYLLPAIEHIKQNRTGGPKVLLILPKKKLPQINSLMREFSRLANYYVCFNGVKLLDEVNKQIQSSDILISTAKKTSEMMREKSFNIKNISLYVIDGVDNMQDDKCQRALNHIKKLLGNRTQICLFLSNWSQTIQNAIRHLIDPDAVIVEIKTNASSVVPNQQTQTRPQTNNNNRNQNRNHQGNQRRDFTEQVQVHSSKNSKIKELLTQLPLLINSQQQHKIIVFVNSKHLCDELSNLFNSKSLPNEVVNGDKSKGQKQSAIDGFRNQEFRILIATDMQLDVEDVTIVVSFDLPQSFQNYLKRVSYLNGKGLAITLISENTQDKALIQQIIKHFKQTSQEIPDQLYELSGQDNKNQTQNNSKIQDNRTNRSQTFKNNTKFQTDTESNTSFTSDARSQILNNEYQLQQLLKKQQLDYEAQIAELKKQQLTDSEKQQRSEQELINEKNKVKQAQEKAKRRIRQVKREGNNQILENLIRESQAKNGQIDICFVLDITGSMDYYKQRAAECITSVIFMVKNNIGRSVRWGFVGYRDFAEKVGGKYDENNFTENEQEVISALEKLKCQGGGDAAEDLKGGLTQCLKLNWQNKFKLCIIICDSPGHGKKYYEPTFTSDDHKNEDMDSTIKEMISKKIVGVGINITTHTKKMFQIIKQSYQQSWFEHKFLIHDLNPDGNNIETNSELVNLIFQGTEEATMTNCRKTISNHLLLGNVDTPVIVGGAQSIIEKYGQYFDENRIFQRSEMKSFKVYIPKFNKSVKDEDLFINFKKLNPTDHIVVSEPESLEFLMSKDLFAKGVMKEVFLIKNVISNQMFVIKRDLRNGNYKTLEEAKKECVSHLMASKLLKVFQKEYQHHIGDRPSNSFQYSQLLILEENPRSLWIAERFIKGYFIKYNNNFGHISIENKSDFIQAFTYFSLFETGGRLMICDIQGVGQMLTDPAICTSASPKFDSTDMGPEGQFQFIINFMSKGHGHQIIKQMGIYI